MDASLKQVLRDADYKGEYDLASLVEACGEHFDSFEVRGKTYFSFGSSKDSSGMKINPFLGAGKTPEEAVARLWLALNRKEV